MNVVIVELRGCGDLGVVVSDVAHEDQLTVAWIGGSISRASRDHLELRGVAEVPDAPWVDRGVSAVLAAAEKVREATLA